MSMILDALSRAEKERQAENATGLDTTRYVTSSTIKEDRFKKWVLIALLANFVLIIVVLGGFLWKTYLQPKDSQIVEQTADGETPKQIEIMETTKPDTIVNEKVTIIAKEESVNVEENRPLSTSSLLDEAHVAKIKPKASAKKIEKIAKKNPPVQYSNQPLSKPEKSVQIANVQNDLGKTNFNKLTDTPVADRSRLSQLEVNVHVYDDNPQSRFVLINMVKYKEGDRLPGGRDIVSSIVPEGVIIDYGSGSALLERNQ